MDLDYFDTFIAVATDCKADRATIPVSRNGQPTIAMIHYDLLSAEHYGRSQHEVLFETFVARQYPGGTPGDDELAILKADFESRHHACLRASPLTKSYGWGIHFDSRGRAALVPRESSDYRRFVEGVAGVKVVPAMRNTR